MKKVLLILVALTLCLSMLTSCGALIENATDVIVVGVIDSVQAEYEEKGYYVTRADAEELESATNAFKEQFGSEFKGEVTHYLICTKWDENMGFEGYVVVYALSELSDGNLIENYFRKEIAESDQEGLTVDINNAGLVVTLEIIYHE